MKTNQNSRKNIENYIEPWTIQAHLMELKKNILNFDDGFEDQAIFRVVHIERLFDILTKKCFHLRNPAKWDDPFENYILKKLHNIGKLDFRADLFGQCWSLHKETDAMWRIYAPDKLGVKLKTSVRKLLTQLYFSEEVGADQYLSCFIGRVKYVGSDELKRIDEHFANIIAGKSSRGAEAVQTLLMKRKEFSHEAEVRLIFADRNNGKYKLGKGMAALLSVVENEPYEFSFRINPNQLIEEIVLDPRMNENTCTAYQDFIRKLGYEAPIYQSSLYKIL